MKLLATLAISSCAFSAMSPADLAAEGAFATVATLDWGQTNGITQGCRESNAIIGACGEHVSPGLYFPAVIVLHVLVDWALPASWRPYFEGVTIGVEMKTVEGNARRGDPIMF